MFGAFGSFQGGIMLCVLIWQVDPSKAWLFRTQRHHPLVPRMRSLCDEAEVCRYPYGAERDDGASHFSLPTRSNDNLDRTRRKSLITLIGVLATSGISPLLNANAEDDSQSRQTNPLENRPVAPIEALVPTIRQKILLDDALSLVAAGLALQNESSTGGNRTLDDRVEIYDKLRMMIEPPPANDGVKRRRRAAFSGNFSQDMQLFSRLSGSNIRSAMNIYTSSLRFGETYALTAPPEIRKQLIREDRLPDVKTVITADLDLRDLYRNRIQTLVEDAQAELYLDETSADLKEIYELLQEAADTLQKWLDLIRPSDIEDATQLSQQL